MPLAFDFESPAAREGWSLAGAGCSLAADRSIAHSGRGSLALDCSGGEAGVSGVARRRLPVATLRGKRVAVVAFLRAEGIANSRAALSAEVDGAKGSLAYADSAAALRAGTAMPWTRFEVEVDVPREATALTVGVLLAGHGRLWLDDLAVGEAAAPSSAPPPSGPAPTAAVDWIRANAIPLAGPSPDLPLADLAPLGRLVGPARIVGLGEATHGSREFFQLKHRLIERLVAEEGFTVVALEVNWPESLEADAYVQGGDGDPAGDPIKALAGFHYWMWSTEEMLDLLRWLRAWNADPRHARKVHVYGFDAQFPDRAADFVAAYLRRVDPDYAATVAGLLGRVRLHRMGLAATGSSPEEPALHALAARLDDRRAEYEAAAGRRVDHEAAAGRLTWTLARQSATILLQVEALYVAGEGGGVEVRDRAMAENVAWLLDQEPPGTRMVLWAHNAHVSLRDPFGAVHLMGEHLRRRFGDGYVAIGALFDQGSFQAIDGSRRRETLAERTLGPAPPEDLGAAFARAGLPWFLLDLRPLRGGQGGTDAAGRAGQAAAAAWLGATHPMREVGAIFTGEAAMRFPAVLPERFDAVLFADRTTRARPLPPR